MQYGSRIIQQQIETATEEQKANIFYEIGPSILQLMGDLFGNYVIQKFFEFGSPQQVQQLMYHLQGNVLSLSMQAYGCRVVQKAIECIPSRDQVCCGS